MKLMPVFRLRNILYLLFLMSHFTTSVIMNQYIIGIIRTLGIIAFVFLAIMAIKTKRKKIDYIEALIILITAWVSVVSLANGTMTLDIAYLIYLWSSTCYIAYNYVNDSAFLWIFCILLNIFAVLNLPFMFKDVGADVYERTFIFGGKNTMQIYFVPAIFMNYFVSHNKYGRLKLPFLIFIVLDLFTVLLCGGSTGIFAVIALVISVVLSKRFHIGFSTYMIIMIVLLLLIFNTQRILDMDILYDFITKTLGKNLTFTERTDIWNFVLPNIVSNPLGYGYGNSLVHMEFPWLNETHNMILETLVIGGIPLLILMFVLIWKLLGKNQTKYANTLLAMCFSFFVIGLMESVQFHSQFWIVLMAYYSVSKGKRGSSDLLDGGGGKNEN